MATLSNFPLLNQRTTTTSDGQLDINHDYDCVPTCIAAGMQYLTGLAYQGGILKEIVYGADYQGGTAAQAYAQYCAQHGVKLYPLSGDNSTLVALAHTHLQQGHPVIFTEPDPYIDLSKYPGSTHVLCFFEEVAGSLTAMDPFGGFAVTKSDQDWMNTLVDGQIWIMAKMEVDETVTISLSTPGVQTFFSQAPGNAWKCVYKNNNFVVGNAILTFYRQLGGAGLCGITHLGLPLGNETAVSGHPGVVEQVFERATLRYDPQHVMDAPPGSGAVYLVHQTIGATATQAQIQQAQALVIDLQHKLASIQQIITA